MTDIASGLNVATQQPLDIKTYFKTLAELQDLGSSNANAFRYYEGMLVYCLETNSNFRWKESTSGALLTSFTYPASTISNGIDYSLRLFNFVPVDITGERSKYRGEWVLSDVYLTDDLVHRNNNLYVANGVIMANTPFTEGTSGATWKNVSSAGTNTWKGVWQSNTFYNQNDFVENNDKIYKSNDVISNATSFVEGTTGPTWKEVSAASFSSNWKGLWSLTSSYALGDYVEQNLKIYKSNSAIVANTPFVEGVAANEWTEISVGDTGPFKGAFNNSVNYTANDVVYYQGLMYYANTNVSAGTFNVSNWTIIGANTISLQGTLDPIATPTNSVLVDLINNNIGKMIYYFNIDFQELYTYNYATTKWVEADPEGNSSWRGQWAIANSYRANSYVYNNNALYISNSDIAASTPFAEGTNPNEWTKVIESSPVISGNSSWRGQWDLTNAYALGDYVEYNEKIYKSNSIIPANTPFAEGTTGLSWREVSPESPSTTWKGQWSLTNSYSITDYVVYNDIIYQANGVIPINTAFEIGTTGPTWREISRNYFKGEVLPNTFYLKDDLVTSGNSLWVALNNLTTDGSGNPTPTPNWKQIGGLPSNDFVSKSSGGQFDGIVRVGDNSGHSNSNTAPFTGNGRVWLGTDGRLILTAAGPLGAFLDIRPGLDGTTRTGVFGFRSRPAGSSSDLSLQMSWFEDPTNTYFDPSNQTNFNGLDGVWWTQFWQPNSLITIGGTTALLPGSEVNDKLRIVDGKLWVEGTTRSNNYKALSLTEQAGNTVLTLNEMTKEFHKAVNDSGTGIIFPTSMLGSSMDWKIINDRLILIGVIQSTSVGIDAVTISGSLPVQARPAQDRQFVIHRNNGGIGVIKIKSNGDLVFTLFSTTAHVVDLELTLNA